MTDLLVIRHAPTAWNADGRLQGRTDIPLSAAGRADADRWTLAPADRARAWFTSPLARAVETARRLGVAATPCPALAEMAWGAWEGERLADLRGAGVLTAEHEAAGLDLRPPGGESPRDVQHRLAPFLAARAAAGQPAGAVTHHGVLRALYALATGWDMSRKPPHRLIAGRGHRFLLGLDGTPTVAALNLALVGVPRGDPVDSV